LCIIALKDRRRTIQEPKSPTKKEKDTTLKKANTKTSTPDKQQRASS
jgi:hypothetical protein